MKKILMVGMAAVAALALSEAQALTLSEAAPKVAEVAENAATMTEVMKQLSAEDQVKFLASVNEAIGNMPILDAEKTAKYLAANAAAMRGAVKGNLPALLAEVYATVPLTALTVINEKFAEDLFKRNANPAKPISDDVMKNLAVQTMKTIEKRMEQTDVSNAAQRNTFAVLMFLRSAGATPADLRETLLAGYPAEVASEWVPAAMGEGEPKTYAPMLAIGEMAPDEAAVMAVAETLVTPASLPGAGIAELAVLSGDSRMVTTPFTDAMLDPIQYAIPSTWAMDNGIQRLPRSLNEEDKWYSGGKRGDTWSGTEPGGYPSQN